MGGHCGRLAADPPGLAVRRDQLGRQRHVRRHSRRTLRPRPAPLRGHPRRHRLVAARSAPGCARLRGLRTHRLRRAVGRSDGHPHPGARRHHRHASAGRAARNLGGPLEGRVRGDPAGPRLHADHARHGLSDPRRHLLRRRRGARHHRHDHLRAAPGRPDDRARHPSGRRRTRGGCRGLRHHLAQHPAAGPAAARPAHDHGGHQPGHHAGPVHGGHRRHGRRRRPRRFRLPRHRQRRRRPRLRGGRLHRHPGDVPGPDDRRARPGGLPAGPSRARQGPVGGRMD